MVCAWEDYIVRCNKINVCVCDMCRNIILLTGKPSVSKQKQAKQRFGGVLERRVNVERGF